MPSNHPSHPPQKHPRILIVDDDTGQRSLLQSYLGKHDFSIFLASSAREALEHVKSSAVDLVISDVRMPEMSGLEMLRQLRAFQPDLPVLMVTAFPDIRGAVDAMRDGALNYLEKPLDLDELLASVRTALGLSASQKPHLEGAISLPEGIICHSPQMQEVVREVSFIAPSEVRVLITGESGVGKEVVADLIHALSPRSQAKLVKINCAAIPETLLESELFGHEKGAFTGATQPRAGVFEDANGGTLLLDEIAEMSPGLQAKLLRVTQDGTYQRLGSSAVHHTNTRILAATNRNLEKEIADGRFREDLFYRLSVVEIYVPPLRERPDDILPLAGRFATQFSGGRPRFSQATANCLRAYSWPGNIRELRNAMERAVLMARGELILPEHLPRRVQTAAADETEDLIHATGSSRMEEVERTLIIQTLQNNNYNRSQTARELGMSRRALLYKIQRYREEGHLIEP